MARARGSLAARSTVVGALALFVGCQGVLGIEDWTPKPSADAGGECLLPSDCTGSNVCLFRQCSAPCRTDKDCSGPYRCLATADGDACVTSSQASCSDDADCPEETACSAGQCRNPCSTDGDCLEYQSCAGGYCQEALPDASVGGSGGTGGATGGVGGTTTTGGMGGTAGAAGGGGRDGGVGGTSGGTAGAGGGGDAAAGPVCDPTERPLDAAGVFVATDGDDDVNNGTRQAPFATIAKAVEIAKGSGLQFVYLAPGAYQENVVIEDLGAGLTFRGGWLLESGTTRWSADCDPQARLDTQISGRTDAPASTPTIELRGALGNTTFQTLAIRTKLTASVVGVGEGGDTMVGVFVNQTATGSLTLSDVWVASAAGGDGGAGQSPSAGGAVAPCQGVTDCSDGSTGPGGADGETPDRGTYTFDGFVPATGGAATPGAYGENGTPPGGLVTLDCRGCLSIVGCEEQDYTDESAQGTCGCAGSGGAEGTPGGGGGGSIAMYVASSTLQVDLDASLLEAGDGGAGAGAGDSSSPTAGASGAPESAFCETSCNLTTCISGTTNQTSVAGGDGGTGGPAGQSASGAAGPSHALVVVGDGNVALSGSELVNSGGDAPRFDFPSCGNGALDPGEECDDANRIDGDACSNSCTVNCDGAGTLNLVDGTCFQVPPTATSWDVARATCRNIGTGWDLLTFELTEALDATIDSGVLTGSAFWVGYRSFDGGTTFPGVDGSADPQIFWGGGEPSGDGACGELIVPSGALNDLSCVTPRRPICGRRVPNFQLPACLSADGGSCG